MDSDGINYGVMIGQRQRMLLDWQGDVGLFGACQVHYGAHPVDWVRDWVWTYDPRREPAYIPMIPWGKQCEYLEWLLARLEWREDGLVEKSRDAGVTWLNCAFAVWMWLYRAGCKVGIGSRKQQLVDEIGNPDSIFGKLRILIEW